MKIITNVFLIFSILLFFACSNDNDNVSESDRAQALLGQWEYQSIMTDKAVDINGDGTVNIDLFNTQEIRQCLKDNLTFFTKMGVGEKGAYAINENGLSCDDQDPYSTIEEDSYQLIMRILELNRSKLQIETNDNLGGQNVIVTITFKKS